MDRRLAKFEGEVKGENADQEDSYLSDLEALAHRTRAKIQVGSCPFHLKIWDQCRMTSLL